MDLIPWRDIDKWECIRCGKCCSVLDVPVTIDEEKVISRYGDVFTRRKIGVYLKKVGRFCIFYANGKCRIYQERPEACRRYPFYFRKSGEKKAEFVFGNEIFYVYVDRNCSGIGKGRNVVYVIQDILDGLQKIKK